MRETNKRVRDSPPLIVMCGRCWWWACWAWRRWRARRTGRGRCAWWRRRSAGSPAQPPAAGWRGSWQRRTGRERSRPTSSSPPSSSISPPWPTLTTAGRHISHLSTSAQCNSTNLPDISTTISAPSKLQCHVHLFHLKIWSLWVQSQTSLRLMILHYFAD